MLATAATGSAVVVSPTKQLWLPQDKEGRRQRQGCNHSLWLILQHGKVQMLECSWIHAQKIDPQDPIIDMLPPPPPPGTSSLEACKRRLGVKVLHVALHRHPLCPSPRSTLCTPLGVAAPTPLLPRCQQCIRGRAMRRPPARWEGGVEGER
jgi:hypothetical protein